MSDCAVLMSANELNYHRERDSAEGCTDTRCYPSPPLSITTDTPFSSTTVTDSTCSHSTLMDVNDNCEPNSEIPLRRSKRGKGRGNINNNVITSGANGMVSVDERVASCVVSGVEYHPGDFVYYEEADFEYYTIGLIEEIKFSRRDKFAVSVKCFYRTHDIPESVKHSVLERELFHSPSNAKLKHEVLSRELFVSEVQETLASKQLRGHCKVTHLSDLRTALNTFCPNEEDNFFYVFAYNPESKRLLHTRAEIRVGDAFQAAIPNFRHSPPAHYRHDYSRCRFRCRKHGYPHRRRRNRRCSTYPVPNHTAETILPESSKSGYGRSQRTTAESFDSYPNKSPDAFISTAVSTCPSPQPIECSSIPPSTSPGAKTKSDDNTIEMDVLKSPPTLENFGSVTSTAGSPGPCSHPRRWRGRGCPSLIDPITQRRLHRHRCSRRWETVIWCPQRLANSLTGPKNCNSTDISFLVTGDISDEPLKTYLDAVRSMVAFFGFGGADDDLASAENGLVLANLASTTQHAYDTLHKSNYSLKLALKKISCNPIPSKNTPRHWTADQVRLFAHALRIRGKDFHAIQRDFFGGQSTNAAVGSTSNPSQHLGSNRTRGRGRRKVVGVSSSKSLKPDEDHLDMKSEIESKPPDSSKSTFSTDDLLKDDVCDVPRCDPHPEPIKTVKDLIAFYYYWKRKGANASSGSITGTQIGLSSAADVNFSAAVAAAAASDCTLNTNMGANGSDGLKTNAILQQQNSQQQPQQWTSNAKKKKQNSRGTALRASSPTSEVSESADASPLESDEDAQMDYEDTKIIDDADFASAKLDSAGAVSSGTAGDSDVAEIPPSGRLRRRLCRNCGKDLSLSNETAHLTGTSQLRFLCSGCRTHLQKYGELKFAPICGAQPSDDGPVLGYSPTEAFLTDGIKPDHSPYSPHLSSWDCDATQVSPLPNGHDRVVWHYNYRSSGFNSPCSHNSRRSSSFCSSFPESAMCFSSNSSFSSASSRSTSPLESASDSCTSDSDRSHLSSANDPRDRKSRQSTEYTYKRRCTKRRRFQRAPDPIVHHAIIDKVTSCPVPSPPVSTEDQLRVAKSPDHLEIPSYQPPTAPSPTVSLHSVPECHLVSSADSLPQAKLDHNLSGEQVRDQATSYSTPRIPSPTDHSKPVVIPPPFSRPASHSDVRSTDSDTDNEVAACLSFSPRSPIPCMKEVHHSMWSHLFRTLDRSVRLVLPGESTNRVVYNTGSCSRTDLIYTGRDKSSSELAEARRLLYSLHTDTAIGPGTSVIDRGIPYSFAGSPPPDAHDGSRFTAAVPSTTTYATSSLPSAVSEAAVLNLSSRSTTYSSSPVLCNPLSRAAASSCVSVASICSDQSSQNILRSITPKATSNQFSSITAQSYDPSHTQQQIQAAYEQAMLLAAAAAAAQHPNHTAYHTQLQQTRESLHQPHTRPSTSHSSRSNTPVICGSGAKPGHTNATHLSARLGAASGTFYPPTLGPPGRNLSPAAALQGRSQNLTSHTHHPLLSLPQIQPWPSSTITVGAGSSNAPHIPQYTSHQTFPTHNLSNSSASAEAMWRNPAFLQRQMALMGLLPQTTLPEQLLYNNPMDPREVESLRRIMAEKLANHMCSSSSSGHFASAEQHQEFLALAAATEMLMRNRATISSGLSNNELASFIPNSLLYLASTGCSSGAMTSAVNSINTRPTPSVQSPHFRHPSSLAAQPPHHSTVPRHSYGPSQSHPPDPISLPFLAGFHVSPPTAHSNSASPLSRTSTTPVLSAANFISLLNSAHSTPHAKASSLHQNMSVPITCQTIGSAVVTTSISASSRSSSTGPSAAQHVQEQMLNAAKLAMLAANAQSDPNKAFAFAAALAEIAVQEKLQSQPAHFGHLMSQFTMPQTFSLQQQQQQQSQPKSSLPVGMFDFRNPPTGGPYNENAGAGSSFSSDRRRSGSLGGLLSGPVSPSLLQSPQVINSGRPVTSTAQSHARHLSTPTTTAATRYPPLSLSGLAPNLPVFSPSISTPSPSQLAQFSQLAHSAGLPSTLPLHDPAVLNAFALAAAAAYAAGPLPPDASHHALLSGFSTEDHHLDRNRLPGSVPTMSGHRVMTPQQQQQAAAMAAFAALPHLNLGARLPPPHR